MSIFKWDYFSDQPYQISDKDEKKRFKKQNRWKILKTIFLSIFIFPIAIFRLIFPTTKQKIDISDFFGIGINLDKGLNQIVLLQELDLKNINIRFPLSDMDKISEYINFVTKFKDYKILLTVIQNRENIENLELFSKNIQLIFREFSKIGVVEFQIGNAINRSKWGFFSVTEYLDFYKIAFKVKEDSYPNIKLVGSAVIDFEYYNSIHTLYNFQEIKYDSISSLLYVDRRGAPENRQSVIFNLDKKIELLWNLVRFSNKSANSIYITETNYPIKNRKPYTPTSEFETVSLQDYKMFMVRYFLIAISSQRVERVYWHQLISAGYGLVDNQNNHLKKYPAFNSLKILLQVLQNQTYISHNFYQGLYSVEFSDLEIYWTISDEVQMHFLSNKKIIDINGNIKYLKKIKITQSPIYLFK